MDDRTLADFEDGQGQSLPDVLAFVAQLGEAPNFLLLNSAAIQMPSGPGSTLRVPISQMRADFFDRAYPLVDRGVNAFPHLTLGRTSNNDIWVNDDTVSKFHAFLTLEGSAWRVSDSKSSANSTFVNGDEVPKARGGVALAKGDLIRVGRVELRFADFKELVTLASHARE